MQQHNDAPGSPAWHARRAACFNASDAPAMLGCSPLLSRAKLLQELHTGVQREFSDYVQERVIDQGHSFEALARPLAEEVIGEELYPVGGSEEFPGIPRPLGASFDGLTLDEQTAFEHKRLNEELRSIMVDGCTGADLPKMYRVQMEQQCMVSGCARVLFMASKWRGDTLVEERHCWYEPDAALRAEIIAGWKQFAADLAVYSQPTSSPLATIAAPVQALPAVLVQVAGSITITDNFKVFETALRDFLEHRLIREPQSDQDFADLDQQIKAMKGAEAALDAAESQMLAQIATVDTAKKTKDMLAKLVRDNRLMAEKLLASEKERRRGEIVAGGIGALREHIAALNTRLGKPYMPVVPADFASAIKGRSSLAKMEAAVDSELTRAKLAANEIADRIQLNLAHLVEHAADFKALFTDTATIVLKAPDDLQALVTARIAEHRAAEEKRLNAERERIRAEEAAKLQRQQEEALRAQQATPAPTAAPTSAPVAAAAPMVVPMTPRPPAAAPATAPTLKLGQIGERLGFTVTADFLKRLGFDAAARERSAVLYHEADFALMCDSLVAHIRTVQHQQQQAA